MDDPNDKGFHTEERLPRSEKAVQSLDLMLVLWAMCRVDVNVGTVVVGVLMQMKTAFGPVTTPTTPMLPMIAMIVVGLPNPVALNSQTMV